MNIDPLTITVAEAIRAVGIGRTSFYAAISAGKIRTKKFGRRTLVEVESLRGFVDALPSDAVPSNSKKVALDTSTANVSDSNALNFVARGGNK